MVRATTREGTGLKFESQHHTVREKSRDLAQVSGLSSNTAQRANFCVKSHVTYDLGRVTVRLAGGAFPRFKKNYYFLLDFRISKNPYHL